MTARKGRAAAASDAMPSRAVLIVRPYAIARGLTGDARILAVAGALTAALDACNKSDVIDGNPDLVRACSNGWELARSLIARTHVSGLAGVEAKLAILADDIEGNGDSELRWKILASIRRDLRRLLPRAGAE